MKVEEYYNYSNDPMIDKRIIDICNQAEQNYNISKTSLRQTSSLKTPFSPDNEYIPTETKTATDVESIHSVLKPFENNTYTPNLTHHRNIMNSNIISQRNPTINNTFNNNNTKPLLNPNKTFTVPKTNQTVQIDRNIINQLNNSVSLIQPKTIPLTSRINMSNNNNVINKSLTLDNMSLCNCALSSSISTCFECEIRRIIQDKNCFNEELNTHYKQNKAINQLLLKAKTFISKNKYNAAYEILHPYILQKLTHPDLFYLYGETCRNLKLMEDAEKFLLLALNYENHSPYCYYSLGLFYFELKQSKYSNIFLKKFLVYVDNDYIHYLIGKNYFILNKQLKAVSQLTQAIEMNCSIKQYYLLRAEAYKLIGMDDLAKKDKEMVKMLSNKRMFI